MPSNDYIRLRAWLERKGAQCAGTVGNFTQGDQGADFEAWVYEDYSFILARKRLKGVTTGGVTLYAKIGDKDSPVEDDIVYLRQVFRVQDMKREAQKHVNRTPNACAMPRDEHICNQPAAHPDEHICTCSESWEQHEDDNALLTHPGDAKPAKRVERVRGFQI